VDFAPNTIIKYCYGTLSHNPGIIGVHKTDFKNCFQGGEAIFKLRVKCLMAAIE
jgi:hypothetical protein